ncbi:DNA mismatch repair protein MutS [Thermaurantiacus tibetensis]|uniref:DNA mismatch repair protein MutS n=1 Tax=Thermaurantiacus tibetensis TaxID=2759035 RepID=UPI001F29BEB9|nr:DNA mismatch repair protein MutS [Thermaurantiacus tibetensis]
MGSAIAPGATPMMGQVLALKAEAGDALLLVRMGDFYEAFFDDAREVARLLDIALTARGEHEGRPVPMCGIPVHAQEAYLARLVRAGRAVAIAEQMEDPAAARRRGAKAIVRREIVRVLTPGTLMEERLLDPRGRSLLAAVFPAGDRAGLAWADVSTGELAAGEVAAEAVADELARLAPAETLTSASLPGFDSLEAERALVRRFGPGAAEGFGRPALAALGGLLAHIDRTARGAPVRLQPPRRFEAEAVMAIDAASRASLELVRGSGGTRAGSLLAAVDRTVTAAGARLLADALAAPLARREPIEARLDRVEAFLANSRLRAETRALLRQAPDLARALARLAAGRGRPPDLAQIRDGLAAAGRLSALLPSDGPLGGLAEALAPLAELSQALAVLAERPPVEASAGGAIADGADPALDEARRLATDGRAAIAALEATLRAETGVQSLRIRHNGVLGYHVEVPSRHGPVLPGSFLHRQTLGSAMRFDEPRLRALADRIATSAEEALAIEAAHLARLTEAVLAWADAISARAAALAACDMAAALAERAAEGGWVRPELTDGTEFAVTAGRHPVVEAARQAGGEPFVPNDCRLEGEERLWLVTGPNMGGKSTFLRQNALVAVLAQAGSFVPAAEARLGIVDRLFSRVGASDSLAEGRSTFMVEMAETAAILRGATERSLVLLDEVGRGTATWDGLALAWAVTEALAARGCRTLFATHYHELTALAGQQPGIALRCARAKEWNGRLVFLHEIAAGAAPGSFGLEVARVAGVPEPVLARAREVLARLEAGEVGRGAAEALADLPLFRAASPPAAPPRPADALRERLRAVAPDTLSPRAALDLVYELVRLVREEASGR